jgi:hypothetical protein
MNTTEHYENTAHGVALTTVRRNPMAPSCGPGRWAYHFTRPGHLTSRGLGEGTARSERPARDLYRLPGPELTLTRAGRTVSSPCR